MAPLKQRTEKLAIHDMSREQLLELALDAMAALELCLECQDLTWEAEQEAEGVYKKLKQPAK